MLAIPNDQKTFKNTMEPMARYESDARTVGAVVGFYRNVSPHKHIRKASEDAVLKLDEHSSKLTQTPEFYQAIRDYKVQSLTSGEWANLSVEQQRFVNKMLDGLEHSGLQLPKAERDKL